jgi:hypothetical protein
MNLSWKNLLSERTISNSWCSSLFCTLQVIFSIAYVGSAPRHIIDDVFWLFGFHKTKYRNTSRMLNSLMKLMSPADKSAAAAAAGVDAQVRGEECGSVSANPAATTTTTATAAAAVAAPAATIGKKRPRSANRVKRTRSPHAFNLYCNDYRDFLKTSKVDISFGEMGKVLAGAWRILAEPCRNVCSDSIQLHMLLLP